ncbi:MAG TPA: hypothetical protein ENF20_06110, partial [Candidatus Marinimicrobia bacterium]|nr:hypothetical protein [Candidatus Neomarinimicrobiota bacterium]
MLATTGSLLCSLKILISLVKIFLNGTEDECATEALEEVEIGGNTGYILSPGCDIPYNVPKENLIAIGEALH